MTEELETANTGHSDSVIQRWIGVKTPREIADMTGLEPFEVVRRAHQILEEVDVLTLRQQQVQFLQNLNRIARETEEAAKDADPEFKAGLYNNAISSYKEILRRLETLEARQDAAVDRLNAMRVRELLRLFDAVVGAGVLEIERKYNIPAEELELIFRDKLTSQAAQLDAGGSY